MKRPDPWILPAIAVAILLRFVNLDSAPLWYDEIWTAEHIRFPWKDIVPELLYGDYNANHVPFYFVVLKAWSELAGTSPAMLRLPSVVFSVVTVIFIAGIARTAVDLKAARWATWLAAVSPYLLHHAQEARMYPLMSALAAAAIFLLARFLKGDSPRLGVTFVLVNLALLATHYYAMFIVSAVVLVPLLLRPQPAKNWLPAVAVTSAGLLALVLAALLVAGHQSGELYEIGLLAFPGVVWSMLSGYTLMPSAEELHGRGLEAILPYLAVAIIAILPFTIALLAGVRALKRDAAVLILTTLAIPLLGPFLVRIVFPDVSINPRYAMPAAPSFLVLLGAGLARGFGQGAVFRLSAMVLAGILLAGSVLHLLTPGHGREDIRAAGDWLDQHIPASQEILITSNEMLDLARYHWPERRFRLYPDRKTVADRNNAAGITESLPDTGSSKTLYIFGRAWISDPDGALRAELENTYPPCTGLEVRGIRILCLERDGRKTMPVRR